MNERINSLWNLLNSNYPEFRATKYKEQILHINWPDTLVFLYFLEGVLKYDKERLSRNDSNYTDLYGLILIMRQVGIHFVPSKKYGFTIKPIFRTEPYKIGWKQNEWLEYRSYLQEHSNFIVNELKEIGVLFDVIS